LGNSLYLENEKVAGLAEKIAQARKLYGPDSSFVIGLLTGIDWLIEEVEGGQKVKDLLQSRILDEESGKPSRTPVESGVGGTPGGGTGPVAGEALAENTWIKGVVKWFNNDKGYGFISTDSHIDVFVHWRDISSWDRSLTQGDEVEFMVTRTAKGFQAINVMKAGEGEQAEGDEGKEDNREDEGVVEPVEGENEGEVAVIPEDQIEPEEEKVEEEGAVPEDPDPVA